MDIIKRIQDWLKDFDKTQPFNLSIDDDTFEGSAYMLLCEARDTIKQQEKLSQETIRYLKDYLSYLHVDAEFTKDKGAVRRAEKVEELIQKLAIN